jgi:hypothetical protein
MGTCMCVWVGGDGDPSSGISDWAKHEPLGGQAAFDTKCVERFWVPQIFDFGVFRCVGELPTHVRHICAGKQVERVA